MKRNLYYQTIYRRENLFKHLFFSFFNLFASSARMLLEVFIRKDFGERYFRLSSAIILTAELIAFPLLFVYFDTHFASGAEYAGEDLYNFDETPSIAPQKAALSWLPGIEFLLWYVFAAAFLYFSIRHYQDKKRQPSVFDFEKFSLSSGVLQDYVWKLPLFKEVDLRDRECFLEPGLFLAAGFLLAVIGQYIGILLILCSLFYFVSYWRAYSEGDNFIMDHIDEMIVNQDLEKNFVNGMENPEDINNTGFVLRAQLPNGNILRRQLLHRMIEDDGDEQFDDDNQGIDTAANMPESSTETTEVLPVTLHEDDDDTIRD